MSSNSSAGNGSQDRSRSYKVRALLAGGLVFGIGAASTLAAWNDNEYAKGGPFTAGTFAIEGSATGEVGSYAGHKSSATSESLTFSAPINNLSPGSVVYADFWVRLTADATVNGELELIDVDGSGDNVDHLSYAVHQLSGEAQCNAAGVGSATVDLGSGAALDTDPESGEPVALTAGAGSTAGDPIHLCFVVTADDDLLQSKAATATWQLQASSTS